MRIAPLSASSVYHAVVRITNDTKNGTSSISRKKFLRFARNAIQYVTGKATTNAATVAAPAYTSERTNVSPY